MTIEELKSAISFGNSDLNIFTISENVVSFVSSSHKRKGVRGSCLYKGQTCRQCGPVKAASIPLAGYCPVYHKQFYLFDLHLI